MADAQDSPGSESAVPEVDLDGRVVRHRIVIVGGGFAGATLAQHLERQSGPNTEIIVLSRDNHLVFTPMLPEVAGRTISPLHVVVPGRLMTKHTLWFAAEVTDVDLDQRVVHYSLTHGGTASARYSHLVFACGQGVDLSVVPGLAAHALALKSVGDAAELGNEVIARFEQASLESDPAVRQRLLTLVVIGGGFTGVETAGHLLDLMQATHRYHPVLRDVSPRLVMLQRGERILPELQHESLSAFALRKLRDGGVDVRLKTEVEEVTATQVCLKGGERIDYGLVVCAVGTAAAPLIRHLGLPLEKGRIKTTGDMRVEGHERLWALGDCAMVPNAYDGKSSPPTAQFALRQAKQLAANLSGSIEYGADTRPFRFHPQGLLASIGHRNGVAEVYGIQFSGFLAWLFWRGVYLWKIPTLTRKLGVGMDWLLDLLSPPEVVLLPGGTSGRMRSAHFARGDTVFRKGDPGEEFYVIERGRAAAYLNDDAPPVATLGEGDHFGEGALLSEGSGRHGASVKAESPLDVLVLGKPDFERLSRSLGSMHKDLERSLLVRKAYDGLLRQSEHDPRLKELRVADVLGQCAAFMRPGLALADAVDVLGRGGPGCAVVREDGSLAGYCGRTEIYSALARSLPVETPVEQFMRPDPPSVRVDQPVMEATLAFLRLDMDALPVINGDGRTVRGLFTPLDLFRALHERTGQDQHQLAPSHPATGANLPDAAE